MRRIAAALMLVASTSAQAQTYNPVEILPTDIPSIPSSTSTNPPVPTNLGDDATKEVDLGFTFTYFGQDFTKAWISSNGFVSFQSSANLCCNGQPLEQAQRNTIYEYWTDLINWTGTPYYSKQKLEDGTNSLLVGWYGTYEYGGNKVNSFEMYLYDNGGIVFNYIDTKDMMRGHTVTAGLTGPTANDNILLFRGSDTSTLSQKAYGFNFQTGTITPVDCNITPMDPSCPTQNLVIPGVPSVTPEVTPSQTVNTVEQVAQSTTPEITQQVVESVSTTAEADTVEQTVTEQAVAEQQAVEQQTATVVATSSTATAATRETTTSRSAERLSPTQLASLNAGGSVSADSQQSSAVSTSDAQQSGEASAKASMQLFTNASNSSIAMAEAEQQQQLQSSVDSSSSSAQISSIAEQSAETLQISTQVASGSGNDVKSNTTYQDRQKLAGIDSTNKDSTTSTVQQVLQPEQILPEASQQYNTGNTQQIEEDKSTIVIVQTEVQQSSVASAEGRWQESLASQSATLEALNTISNGNQSSGDSQESPSSLGEGQTEVISQMAYVAGFSAYKLVTLPDRPDFYKPRRIYANNRPVDAYMSIFKMTAANDNLWKQMVESQYE